MCRWRIPRGWRRTWPELESLEFQVAVLPLLRREVEVARLVVDGFQAELRVASDGSTNFGPPSEEPPHDPLPADPPEEEAAPMPGDPEAPAPAGGGWDALRPEPPQRPGELQPDLL
jgi:hypothetical protein